VITNEKNELIPTRTITGWRMCIDYRKLNSMTRNDHFPLPFMDQILERVAGYEFYCFLDGYSGYNQIEIALEDQEKTTFTCLFGTFAYRRMPFGLCWMPFDDYFPDESLLFVSTMPWFANIVNFLVSGRLPTHWSTQDKRKFLNEVKNFYWDDPYLFKYCPDQIFRRCIPDNEVSIVIKFCHSEVCGGHFSSRKTTAKIKQSGFYWPTMFKDSHAFCKTCENCQKLGSISKRHMMLLNPILVIEIFDC